MLSEITEEKLSRNRLKMISGNLTRCFSSAWKRYFCWMATIFCTAGARNLHLQGGYGPEVSPWRPRAKPR